MMKMNKNSKLPPQQKKSYFDLITMPTVKTNMVKIGFFIYNNVGVKKYFDPYDTTDCSAFHAPASPLRYGRRWTNVQWTFSALKHLKFTHFSAKNGYFSVFLWALSSKILLQASLHRIF